MKTIFFFVLSLFISSLCLASQDYFISAPNGLLIRESPNSSATVTGKFDFGTRIKIVKKTDTSYSVVEDDGTKINGNWAWVEASSLSSESPQIMKGYVFDGFLKKEKDFVDFLANQMKNTKELENYELDIQNDVFSLQGDFFNDGVLDIALLLKDSQQNKHIAFIDYKNNNTSKIVFLDAKNTSFDIKNYNWVGYFFKVKKQETLWSNYEEDFRAFEEVPAKERVKLEYDAIYVHAFESCGGGFIFWKDGKFKWLQQE